VESARVRVKICGLTRAEDAAAAVALGADALGFNTWRGSKRYLDLALAGPWLRELPPYVTRVALTVNAPLDEARRIASLSFVDAVQVHGDEDAAYCRALAEVGRPIIKALRLGRMEDLKQAEDYPAGAMLLDAQVAGEYGGTGVSVELALAQEFRRLFPGRPLILAGGLKPDTVAGAVAMVRPYAVDVSSGVESAPGKKDPALMRAFVEAVRGVEPGM
jgi:phosphoribosylanthranilate isomerase